MLKIQLLKSHDDYLDFIGSNIGWLSKINPPFSYPCFLVKNHGCYIYEGDLDKMKAKITEALDMVHS